MTTTTDFAKQLSRFFSEYLLYERNVSANTIASYRDTFTQFIDYMKDVKDIEVDYLHLTHLTRENVENFLKWLLDVRKCSFATRNYRLAAIRSFCAYLQYAVIEKIEEWQKIRSIKAIKTEGSTLNYLTIDGIKLLLEQPDTTSWRGRRDLALLSLMYGIGARVSEISDLTVDCVRIGSEPYTIRVIGKGRKARIVPLVKEQVNILSKYMDENKLNDNNKGRFPLFYNNRGEKLTREGVTHILQKYADMARKLNPELIPNRLSCHSLRHSKAMHLLQSGVNIVYIRDILGHASIKTTDIYARADSRAKREAIEKAYINLTPEQPSDKVWEKNKNLREWLKGLSR